MKYKKCSSCGRTLGAHPGNFAPYAGRSVDGLRPICRDCVRAYDRERKHKKYHEQK
jgi:hypothetical protein